MAMGVLVESFDFWIFLVELFGGKMGRDDYVKRSF